MSATLTASPSPAPAQPSRDVLTITTVMLRGRPVRLIAIVCPHGAERTTLDEDLGASFAALVAALKLARHHDRYGCSCTADWRRRLHKPGSWDQPKRGRVPA